VEALFTSALGLQSPWVVEDVKLEVSAKRIDFEVSCSGALLNCPACDNASQPVHDRLRRSWRHLDFFQFEAWAARRRAAGGLLRLRQDHPAQRAVGAARFGLHGRVRGAGAVPRSPGAPGR
jgi:hypothetical protein